MIYTVTFNPSLDYIVTVEHLKLGAVNRTNNEIMNPGGKGINVSLVLRNLGYDSTALGFQAGFTGREIARLVDILVLAGSIPSVMPETMYRDIMEYLSAKNLRIVVDATKDLLRNVLKFHPFLIKPNNHELGEIYGVELRTREEVIPYARKLQEEGARNVLISMAGEGAVLLAENGDVYQSEAPKGEVKNSVGAGDSMVAGFIRSLLGQLGKGDIWP